MNAKLSSDKCLLTAATFFSDTLSILQSNSERKQQNVKLLFFCCSILDSVFPLLSDGKQIWEVEATVDRDKTQAVSGLPLTFTNKKDSGNNILYRANHTLFFPSHMF